MYRKITLLCSLLLSAVATFAQNNNSLLWKISGKDIKQPSYLFGTIHLICHNDYVWTPIMQKALDSSVKVAFEMDMDDPDLLTKITQGMQLHDGKNSKELYTEDEYKQLTEYAKDNGIPVEMIDTQEPFSLLSMLYMKMLSCSIPESYEGNIMKLALQSNKEIVGLETVEEQLAVINNMSDDSIGHTVVEMIKDMNAFKIQYQQMVDFYKQQNLPSLYNILLETPDYKGDLNTLLYDRNTKWISEIETLANAQSTFIAVGAGHLWGDKGVIALLKKKGYKVEPVK
ncbi:TraB/GumN family protein [Taibaiella lutea]|uniref:TraB/GumN family protein n=1 Tax=Taibaiella lutea TaxID=2608001 RepID=A0A5M6CEN9_9BACT|nr:TraB/GumN family protein [Taibaiella lutea]KAA5532362.1 TraB/GumN family protein [Taibaiella lutea]